MGEEGHPWADGWVPGGARREKEKGAPKWEGSDYPNGRGAKDMSEEGDWGAGQVSAFSTRAQCWRGFLPIPGTWRTSDP